MVRTILDCWSVYFAVGKIVKRTKSSCFSRFRAMLAGDPGSIFGVRCAMHAAAGRYYCGYYSGGNSAREVDGYVQRSQWQNRFIEMDDGGLTQERRGLKTRGLPVSRGPSQASVQAEEELGSCGSSTRLLTTTRHRRTPSPLILLHLSLWRRLNHITASKASSQCSAEPFGRAPARLVRSPPAAGLRRYVHPYTVAMELQWHLRWDANGSTA